MPGPRWSLKKLERAGGQRSWGSSLAAAFLPQRGPLGFPMDPFAPGPRAGWATLLTWLRGQQSSECLASLPRAHCPQGVPRRPPELARPHLPIPQTSPSL